MSEVIGWQRNDLLAEGIEHEAEPSVRNANQRHEGVAGLRDRPRSGRPGQLSEAQLAELARLVEAGPDPAVHRVVRWRCVDLQGEIRTRFGVEISERHVGRLLQRLKFTRLSVRPRHPQADEAVQREFKKTSPRP